MYWLRGNRLRLPLVVARRTRQAYPAVMPCPHVAAPPLPKKQGFSGTPIAPRNDDLYVEIATGRISDCHCEEELRFRRGNLNLNLCAHRNDFFEKRTPSDRRERRLRRPEKSASVWKRSVCRKSISYKTQNVSEAPSDEGAVAGHACLATEGEITKPDNDSPTFDSSRILY